MAVDWGSLAGGIGAICMVVTAYIRHRTLVRVKGLDVDAKLTDRLMSRIESQDARIERADEENEQLQRKYAHLERDMDRLTHEKETLVELVAELEQDKATLTTRLEALAKELKNLYRDVDSTRSNRIR